MFKWFVFEPVVGLEKKINAEFADLMADPSAFMVYTPEILEQNPHPKFANHTLNLFPLHLVEEGDLSGLTDLLCIVMVIKQHPKWFMKVENLEDAQQLLAIHGYMTKQREPGCFTTLLIKSEYIELANKDSLYF